MRHSAERNRLRRRRDSPVWGVTRLGGVLRPLRSPTPVPSRQPRDGLFVQLPDLSGVSIDLGEQRFATFWRETRLQEGLQLEISLEEMGR